MEMCGGRDQKGENKSKDMRKVIVSCDTYWMGYEIYLSDFSLH